MKISTELGETYSITFKPETKEEKDEIIRVHYMIKGNHLFGIKGFIWRFFVRSFLKINILLDDVNDDSPGLPKEYKIIFK